jgi:hypothetical protein
MAQWMDDLGIRLFRLTLAGGNCFMEILLKQAYEFVLLAL